MLQEMLSLLEKVKLLQEIMLLTLLKMKKYLLKVMLTLQREDSIMLGDELSIDLKTSSSKLISKK